MAKRKKLTNAQRAKIFADRQGICELCTRPIRPGEPWELDHPLPVELGGPDTPDALSLVHAECHKQKTHGEDRPRIEKSTAVRKKHLGLKARKGPPMPGTKASGWKKKMDGTVVRRDEE
jgi:5-methylcytosine-specific restriction enzyme A